MNAYNELGWISYLWTLITGDAIHLNDCVIKPGWRYDHVWKKTVNDGRNYCRIRSRLLRALDWLLNCIVDFVRAIYYVCQLVIHFLFTSKSYTARMIRWLIGLAMAIFLEQVVLAMA